MLNGIGSFKWLGIGVWLDYGVNFETVSESELIISENSPNFVLRKMPIPGFFGIGMGIRY